MCDMPSAPADLAAADDATVIEAIERYARAEAVMAAHRLAAIAELIDRRCRDDDDPRALWACDMWDSAAAEVGAALTISPRRASTQMNLAWSLRHRLPAVTATFRAGDLPLRLASVIAWRTHLIEDIAIMAKVDADIAEQARSWGPLSETRLGAVIDQVVACHDPEAVVRFADASRRRDVQFGKPDDETGTASLWGRLHSPDAAVLDQRLAEMARGVCDADPRLMGQRRSDALGAIAAGADRLTCQCGQPDCAAAQIDSRRDSVVIHVIADQTAVAAASSTDGASTAPPRRPAALMVGGGVIPAPLLTEMIRSGAKLRTCKVPNDICESRYRPSAELQRFVRLRDLTCRFPGCDMPAQRCDIDHGIAYPVGPTHPSNTRCLCRKHHLLKTFWAGRGGWSDIQLPDGTIVWTAPSGRRYTTHPGSRVFFPDWDIDTGTLTVLSARSATPDRRALNMPVRRRTRAAARAQRIKNQRALNDTS